MPQGNPQSADLAARILAAILAGHRTFALPSEELPGRDDRRRPR
jgi:hypothetical protein